MMVRKKLDYGFIYELSEDNISFDITSALYFYIY